MQCSARNQWHHHQHEDLERMSAGIAVEFAYVAFYLMNDAIDVAISWATAIM